MAHFLPSLKILQRSFAWLITINISSLLPPLPSCSQVGSTMQKTLRVLGSLEKLRGARFHWQNAWSTRESNLNEKPSQGTADVTEEGLVVSKGQVTHANTASDVSLSYWSKITCKFSAWACSAPAGLHLCAGGSATNGHVCSRNHTEIIFLAYVSGCMSCIALCLHAFVMNRVSEKSNCQSSKSLRKQQGGWCG